MAYKSMSRAGRKGFFAKPQASTTTAQRESVTTASPEQVTIVTNRGHGVSESTPVDLILFAEIPLLSKNLSKIQRAILSGKTGPSLKVEKRILRSVADYVRWYEENVGACPASASLVDNIFCHKIIVWLAGLDTSDPEKSLRFRMFRRCMMAIGVDDTNIPSNPFAAAEVERDPRKELSPEDARRLLNRAKLEAQIVLKREGEVSSLAEVGRDPRRGRGGQYGDWSVAANRVWVMKNVFKLRIRNFDEMRFEGGLNAELKGLERRPGAEIVAKDGRIERQVGWKGHLRWFFPWSDDLAPFLTMFLLRTGANVASAAALRTDRWEEPYPFIVGDASNETHVYIVTYKTRGRHDTTTSSKPVKFVSSRRPWSHPYRLLLAVETITRNLRAEIDRRVFELRGKPMRSEREAAELERLVAIRDDLFIYKTEQGISSLAWETRKQQGTPKWLAALMSRAGVATGARLLRDGPILFSYEMSGQNLFVAQLIAAHASPATTALYLRRRSTINRIYERAKNVFGLSVDLIEMGKFDIASLKRALAGQGLDDRQIENLASPENVSRWGNGCADPTAPPDEFARGTKSGDVCVEQDCISGCPHARWFRDSIEHVARQLVLAENTIAGLGIESIEGSSIQSRIDRCREFLRRWPLSEVAAAIDSARARLSGTTDLFLGAAL